MAQKRSRGGYLHRLIGEWCFRSATARTLLPQCVCVHVCVGGVVTKVRYVVERDTESVAVCQTLVVKIKTLLELCFVSLVFASGFDPTGGTEV